MLKVTYDENSLIVTLEPQEALSKEDFQNAAKIIDPLIQLHKKLNGIIICTKDFPGWDSFGALIKHLKFIAEHHKKVTHVAFVTDSLIGDVAEYIGSHFVSAQVKEFEFNKLEEAKEWILQK